MAFGRTDPDDPGTWQQQPPGKTDVEPKEPPVAPPPPGTTTGTPVVPPKQEVDVAYVADIAKHNLPDDKAFKDFVAWSRDQLPALTQQILKASGISQNDFEDTMKDWLKAVTEAEKSLNEKADSPSPSPCQPTWPSMPGVSSSALCTSIFDANDLALRGRKSVLVKNFYIPIILPQFLLDPEQKWAFGQKIDYRQEWRHEGFTLGELISSLSLLPNEELTLEVSSWQRTKSEIAEETDTEQRNRLEREQRRTDEESCVNEAAASNGWGVSATGSVSYGPASASVSANVTGNTSERSEQAARQITEATSRAANEVSLKRAVKMSQTAEAGSESRTTRRIKNMNTCHTVTFNFFQIVKLYDVQLRLENDSPTIMLPGIFPATYEDGKTPVVIPYWAIEAFTSPAVFLTQYFEVDRDLSQEIHGFALRVRIDAGRSPAVAIVQLTEALIVATRYLLKLDPATLAPALAEFVSDYVANAVTLRRQSARSYGAGKGRSEQITTPGIYADSLLGRCSGCEASVEAREYVEVMRQHEELLQIERTNKLLDAELERREKLLEAGILDPFDAKPLE